MQWWDAGNSYTILHIYIFHAKWWLQAICLNWHLHVFMCVTLVTRVPLTAFQSLEILWVVGWTNSDWLVDCLYYLAQEKAWDPLHWADDILGSGCEQPFILKFSNHIFSLQPMHLCHWNIVWTCPRQFGKCENPMSQNVNVTLTCSLSRPTDYLWWTQSKHIKSYLWSSLAPNQNRMWQILFY